MGLTPNRWFRAERHRGEIDQLFDLYWGGKERRITNLTLKIMGVNVIAVVVLILGVVYLSQYHKTLVEAGLERFEAEVIAVTAAITNGAFADAGTDLDFSSEDIIARISSQLSVTLGRRILIFDDKGQIVFDSDLYNERHKVVPVLETIRIEENRLESVELLKDMAAWIVSWFPRYETLPTFNETTMKNYYSDYAVLSPLSNNIGIIMSAWRLPDDDSQLVLTAAVPLVRGRNLLGAVMMVNKDSDIPQAMGDAWFDIVKIFFVTLIATILLSIYLSGVIARPLRSLASAAENVRKGKMNYTDIPDMSDRNDEIGELSLALRDMMYALWERMDSIESFAADVAHEIKNPLTSLKSAVETALIVKSKKDLNKLLDVIKDDIDRLDRLITDIAHASRLDSELSREPFRMLDFKDLMRSLLNVYKDPLNRQSEAIDGEIFAQHEGVRIILSMPRDTQIYVRGSEGRLIQVFQNIIANALSFSPRGSAVRIVVQVSEKRVSVSIEDEGPGIPASNLKNVFERFYSERPEEEKYGQHSGLGLSICKQVVTAHNGIIYAENKRDHEGNVTGARFVVILNCRHVLPASVKDAFEEI
ncbi:MAG: sensor histidine kinase, partial [Alphaproteobacteria bacterium]